MQVRRGGERRRREETRSKGQMAFIYVRGGKQVEVEDEAKATMTPERHRS